MSHLFIKGKFISPDVYYYNEKTFCSWIQPSELKYFDDCENSELAFAKEDDNPILVFYDLR